MWHIPFAIRPFSFRLSFQPIPKKPAASRTSQVRTMAFSHFLSSSIVVLVLYALWRYATSSRRPPLPPGPKGLPLVGNLADLPSQNESNHLHWMKHRVYGPLSSVVVFGQTLIIIHDQQACIELLDKRAAKSSSRPWLEFASGM